MRICSYCQKPMHTSDHSEWYEKKNYDVHSRCSENWKLWVKHGGLKRAVYREQRMNPEKIFIEAYMRWEAEHDRGDPDANNYFEGGLDAIIMLAQMLGCSDDWIKTKLTLLKGVEND